MEDLDAFRRQWKDEVKQRQEEEVLRESKRLAREQQSRKHDDKSIRKKRVDTLMSTHDELIPEHGSAPSEKQDDIIPEFPNEKHKSHFPDYQHQHVYENADLNDKQKDALKAFEHAVDRENVGQMADAIKHYREAYRHDEGVEKLYREKYYSSVKPMHGLKPKREEELVEQFNTVTVNEVGEEGPLMHMPTELIVEILKVLALRDLSGFTKTTFTCKKLAHLGYSSPTIWKALCLKEYPVQHYSNQALQQLGGNRDDEVIGQNMYNSKWRKMYMERPRVWFNGVYISTCTYIRPGNPSETWTTPVYMVTYYRYLRFFEDGSCISLLTTVEPADVVPVFNSKVLGATKSHPVVYHRDDGSVVTQPKGIVHGHWYIDSHDKSRLRVQTEGSVDRYVFFMELDIRSSGKNKLNKLRWVRFWNVNKLTQNEGEFSLKHDKAYYFVRTRR